MERGVLSGSAVFPSCLVLVGAPEIFAEHDSLLKA